VAFYGQVDAGEFLSLMQEFQRIAPEYVLVGETQDSILMSARATKENDEIERIRRMGKVTTQVVGRVADMLSTAALRGNQLLNHAGEVLRVGEVKQQINLWLAEAGAENPEGTIFSIGRDAGVPHSTGSAGDALELGKTIVFDIFPCEAQGGYFYDFTRTWCLGYAPDEVLKVYEDVLHVYQTVVSRLAPGKPCKEYQNLTCELFGKQGHPTIQSNPGTTDGYVHSLGHGLGLAVHEAPWFSLSMPGEDRLIPGSVFTIEPGLYYPERGIGVRLEDTYLAEANGTFTKLADFPMDLILPTRKG
jgi:Xaa-Pro aminopeptidase